MYKLLVILAEENNQKHNITYARSEGEGGDRSRVVDLNHIVLNVHAVALASLAEVVVWA